MPTESPPPTEAFNYLELQKQTNQRHDVEISNGKSANIEIPNKNELDSKIENVIACNESCDSFDLDVNQNDSSLENACSDSGNECILRARTGSSSLCSRRVSFPKNDNLLVTGYLEPANPWESAATVKDIEELIEIYKISCQKHNSKPIDLVIEHLKSLDLSKNHRHSIFSLKNHDLTPDDCETFEEIFKRIHYEILDFSTCNLNEISAPSLFDIIEYYEAATELDISDNPSISFRGWQSCIQMIKRSRALQMLTARGNPLSELNATNLGKSLNSSSLHTIKLEHCGLQGKPIMNLCTGLKKNSNLKQLWLACNDLSIKDAANLAELLQFNAHIQFLDISNNNIQDEGVHHIAIALMKQSTNIDLYSKKVDIIDLPILANNKTEEKSAFNANDSSVHQLNSSNGRSMLDALLRIQPKCDPEIVISPDDEIKTILMNSGSSESTIDLINKTPTPPSEYDISSENDKTITNSSVSSIIEDKTNLSQAVNVENKNDTLVQNVFSSSSCSSILSDDLDSAHSADSAFFESSSEGNKISESSSPNGNKQPAQLSHLAFQSVSHIRGSQLQDSLNLLPQIIKPPSPCVVERLRSHSSDSLSSDTSLDGCEPAFSKNVRENLTKNDTLTRQKPVSNETHSPNFSKPRGLRALILWNNSITRESSEVISDLFRLTKSLELLNIGKNCLSNEFVLKVKDSLKINTTVTNLGLQSAHLSCDGIRGLASILQFGGNCTLQRIDVRDNYIQVDCLNILSEALKSNKSVTRIDIDDVPKRISEPANDLQFHYSRALHQLRSLCSHNEKQQMQQLLDSLSSSSSLSSSTTTTTTTSTSSKKCENPKLRYGYFNSRKISLTCQSIINPINVLEHRSNLSASNSNTSLSNSSKLDIKRKSGIRLRSPLPSPPTISPSTSPVPSPLKSRFQVFRVSEDNFFPSSTTGNTSNYKNCSSEVNMNNSSQKSLTKTNSCAFKSSQQQKNLPLARKIIPAARKSRFRVTKVNDEIITNYHSLDASNNINCTELQQQNFIKSKSLPDFAQEQQPEIIDTETDTEEPLLAVIKDDENNKEYIKEKDNISGSHDSITNEIEKSVSDNLGDSGIVCDESKNLEDSSTETESLLNEIVSNKDSDNKQIASCEIFSKTNTDESFEIGEFSRISSAPSSFTTCPDNKTAQPGMKPEIYETVNKVMSTEQANQSINFNNNTTTLYSLHECDNAKVIFNEISNKNENCDKNVIDNDTVLLKIDQMKEQIEHNNEIINLTEKFLLDIDKKIEKQIEENKTEVENMPDINQSSHELLDSLIDNSYLSNDYMEHKDGESLIGLREKNLLTFNDNETLNLSKGPNDLNDLKILNPCSKIHNASSEIFKYGEYQQDPLVQFILTSETNENLKLSDEETKNGQKFSEKFLDSKIFCQEIKENNLINEGIDEKIKDHKILEQTNLEPILYTPNNVPEGRYFEVINQTIELNKLKFDLITNDLNTNHDRNGKDCVEANMYNKKSDDCEQSDANDHYKLQSSAGAIQKSTLPQNKSAVDKLLSIFQNPVDIFSSRHQVHHHQHHHHSNQPQYNQQNKLPITTIPPLLNQQIMPFRKNSPPTLFSWLKTNNNKEFKSDLSCQEYLQQQSPATSVQKFLINNPSDHINKLEINLAEPITTVVTTVNTNNRHGSFFGVASKQFKDFTEFGKQILFNKQQQNTDLKIIDSQFKPDTKKAAEEIIEPAEGFISDLKCNDNEYSSDDDEKRFKSKEYVTDTLKEQDILLRFSDLKSGKEVTEKSAREEFSNKFIPSDVSKLNETARDFENSAVIKVSKSPEFKNINAEDLEKVKNETIETEKKNSNAQALEPLSRQPHINKKMPHETFTDVKNTTVETNTPNKTCDNKSNSDNIENDNV